MLSPGVQLWLALACVALAVAFLLWRSLSWWRGRGSSCGSCPNQQQAPVTPLVPLDLGPALRKPSDPKSR